MEYGLYLAASSVLVNQFRQDVVANNIANINTPGFKPDRAMVQQRHPASAEGSLSLESPQAMLERLGGGVLVNPVQTVWKQGALNQTNRPLDLAIDGDGLFALSTGRGEGNQRFRFARDGRFTLNSEGYLTHATSGMRALSTRNSPIQLDPSFSVQVNADGTIVQNGERVAQLRIVTTEDQSAFRKAGRNVYQLNNNASVELDQTDATVRQGWMEESAVNPMTALMALKSASGAVNRGLQFIRYHDTLMNSAINRLGRVT